MIKKLFVMLLVCNSLAAQELHKNTIEQAIVNTDLEELIYRYYFNAPHMNQANKEHFLKLANSIVELRAKQISFKRSWRDLALIAAGTAGFYGTYKLGRYGVKKITQKTYTQGFDEAVDVVKGVSSIYGALFVSIYASIAMIQGLRRSMAKARHADAIKIESVIEKLILT